MMFGRVPGRRGAAAAVAAPLAWACAVCWAAGPAGEELPAAKRLRKCPSRYYILYTDLGEDVAKEASARMTAMAEEYRRRTREFAGTIRTRFAFYLFARPADYHQAGGPAGSGGIYHPDKRALMAVADGGVDDRLWHVVQHEAFHQFADLVIGGKLPLWINEGLAEYFAQGLWTGDGFLTGVIPPFRLKRLQEHLRAGRTRPFADMFRLTPEQWGEDLADRTTRPAEEHTRARVNYDQAWSMVHFLVFADDGKYRAAFSGLIRDTARGGDWAEAFQRRFGRNVRPFEDRYRQWWLSQKPDATADLYTEAVVATMTSYLARSAAQGQQFASAEDFLREARSGRLKAHAAQWLPAGLLNEALLHARLWREAWSIDNSGRVPRLLLKWPTGTVYTGTFTCSQGKCSQVKVTVVRAG